MSVWYVIRTMLRMIVWNGCGVDSLTDVEHKDETVHISTRDEHRTGKMRTRLAHEPDCTLTQAGLGHLPLGRPQHTNKIHRHVIQS